MGLPFPPPIMGHRSATEDGKNLKEREKKLEVAARYVETVRNTLEKDNLAKYHEFLDVVDDFMTCRISVAEVASRVKALFRDSPDLLVGFNAFLPKEYEIQVGADELAAPVVRDLSSDEHHDGDMSQ